MRQLPTPSPAEAADWTHRELGDLAFGDWHDPGMRGGQTSADAALAAFSVVGYAARRNEVWPAARRGSSGLSPYIRHGLLSLPAVWQAVAGGPARDVEKFHDELLWQEYARHLYARLGGATRRSLRFSVPEHDDGPAGPGAGRPWSGEEACLREAREELSTRGWLTNQQRMWLASHWSVRSGLGWREGEDLFFRQLLDGSRAANRLGWQWTIGALTGKQYGFSRWQVEKRAPGLCAACPLERRCPIQQWPPEEPLPPRVSVDPRIRRDDDLATTAGPVQPEQRGRPEAVWLTAESLGDEDPAMLANPDLPAVFVFDEVLLTRLRLAPMRLLFLAECLADLAQRRTLEVWRGDPVAVLADRAVATTFTPVPGWRSRALRVGPVEIHPWRWLRRPHPGPLTSFTAWSRSAASRA